MSHSPQENSFQDLGTGPRRRLRGEVGFPDRRQVPRPERSCYDAVMSVKDLQSFRHRGARALLLLHERSLREFVALWKKANAAGASLPASQNPAYASRQALLQHGLKAPRNMLVWVCEKLGLPDPAVEEAPSPETVEKEADRYVEHLLSRWRAPLVDVDPARFKESFETRWGSASTIEGMLEHVVLHAQKHSFQLEELLEAQRAGS
jgi:hypothetical protein